MTREEYIKGIEELEQKKRELQKEYIESMPIKPQQMVIIDGEEYWLERYRIIGYRIQPTLYMTIKGKKRLDYGVQVVDRWRTMKPKNA